MTEDTSEELKPVRVSLDVPGQIALDVEELVADGIYMSPEEVLRAWIHLGWRHERGAYHTVRIDLNDPKGGARDDSADDGEKAEQA